MTITLKFGDKELKCSLGLDFVGELIDDTGVGIDELGARMQTNPFKLLPRMVFISAKVEAELNGEEFTMTQREVTSLIEGDGGLGSPQCGRFMEEWTKSMTPNLPQEDDAEEGKKDKKK